VPPDRDLAAISTSPLFRGMAADAIGEVLAAASVRTLAVGESLFLQGDPVEALYVVESGKLKLSQVTPEGEEVVVRTAGEGAILAGVAVLGKRVLPVTGVAVTAARVLVWPRERAQDLALRHPQLRDNVLQTIADRMQESLSRIRELSTESAGRRVARALLRLAREHGRPEGGRVPIDHRLGRQELADLAGTSMFTASRLLALWAREGILEVGRQRVVVRRIAELERLAGGDE
jgi:CRP-like cAMP-binding protein